MAIRNKVEAKAAMDKIISMRKELEEKVNETVMISEETGRAAKVFGNLVDRKGEIIDKLDYSKPDKESILAELNEIDGQIKLQREKIASLTKKTDELIKEYDLLKADIDRRFKEVDGFWNRGRYN